MANGGQFKSGFLAAGATQAFSGKIDGIDKLNEGISAQRTIAAAALGGAASVLGGGKFANGAITGAFSRVFNDDGKHDDINSGALSYVRKGLRGLREFFKVGDTTSIRAGVAGKVGGSVISGAAEVLKIDVANDVGLGVLRFKLDKAYNNGLLNDDAYIKLRNELGNNPANVNRALTSLRIRRKEEDD